MTLEHAARPAAPSQTMKRDPAPASARVGWGMAMEPAAALEIRPQRSVQSHFLAE